MADKQSNDARPNIVVIITDQQRFDTIAALGADHVSTPNLDRLVNEGVSFTNAFITAPTCAPSRASFFSGFYPHTTGIYKNADTWRHSWIERLSAGGYHCVNVGKMHTYPFETPLGFHERFVVENKDRFLEGRYFFDRWDMAMQARGLVKQQRELYRQRPDYRERLGAFEWELPEDLHSDFFVGNLAAWWLDTKPDMQPFFMEVGFPGPHPPYDPIPRYAEPYLKADLPLPEVTEDELALQPPAQRELIEHNVAVDHDSIAWSQNPSREQLHRLRAYYLANVTMIDEKIGGIMQALERNGYLENTVVIFLSDHGDCLGDHGHIQKWVMYDVITRTPLIVWAPGRFDGGRRCDTLCQHFDVAPVIMELAGLDTPPEWETASLAPYLRGGAEERDLRPYVFCEQGGVSREKPGGGFLTGTRLMTMIRSREWKLVHYLDEPMRSTRNGGRREQDPGNQEQGELYNLAEDPGERVNLWVDPRHRGQRERLIGELLRWRMGSGLRTSGWTMPWR